jgi:enterochelin esterase-like enzyme
MKNIAALICIACSFAHSHCWADNTTSFDTFVSDLEGRSIGERDLLVEQYLSKVERSPIIEGKHRAHFVWFGEAMEVSIEGDIQKAFSTPEVMRRIDCGDRDLFHISYTVPADAIVEYRFIADGKRILDPRNPRASQSFDYGDRNVIAMPDFTQAPVTHMRVDIDKGTTNRWVFKTEHRNFTNQLVWVYTPHGYTKSKTYPVLYVYDGMWALYTRPFVNVVDNLIANGKIEPIVVVFLSFEDRWNEYIDDSTQYAEWLVDEMLPFIEGHFQVSRSSAERGIIGASAAGHAAVVTALRHSDVFGHFAAQGGGAGGAPGHSPLAHAALDVYLTKKDRHPLRTLYSEVGIYDLEFPQLEGTFLSGARQFHARLKALHINHTYKEVNGGHNGTVWDQNLDEILIAFFGGRY